MFVVPRPMAIKDTTRTELAGSVTRHHLTVFKKF